MIGRNSDGTFSIGNKPLGGFFSGHKFGISTRFKKGSTPLHIFPKGHKPTGGFSSRFKKGHTYLGNNNGYYTKNKKTELQKEKSKKMYRQAYKSRLRSGGPLPVSRIKMVYEDNIKKYGTLTCYLCLIPIPYKNDSLEHKTPLSRGGNNDYENLAVSCRICNCKKRNKTELEYKERS